MLRRNALMVRRTAMVRRIKDAPPKSLIRFLIIGAPLKQSGD
jgi:hypothetical protein